MHSTAVVDPEIPYSRYQIKLCKKINLSLKPSSNYARVPSQLSRALASGESVSMMRKDSDSYVMQYVNDKPAFHSFDKRMTHIWVPYSPRGGPSRSRCT